MGVPPFAYVIQNLTQEHNRLSFHCGSEALTQSSGKLLLFSPLLYSSCQRIKISYETV
jgi:hypothetical protein